MSDSSRSSNQDENKVQEDDSDSTLLYDILVYREWPPQPDSKLLLSSSEVPQNGGEPALPSNDGWKDRVFSWVKWTGMACFRHSNLQHCLKNYILTHLHILTFESLVVIISYHILEELVSF